MAIITGTSSANLLDGTAAADAISGLGGNDTLNGLGRKDTLLGGTGKDSLNGGTGNDAVNGGAGNDTLNGGTGKDSLKGGTSNDMVNGGAGNDTLNGGTGKDSLVGGAGIDSLVGGGGVDILKGGGGNDIYSIDASDVLVESTGIDTVRASFGYTLLAGFEKLILTGTAAINGTGNTLANTITGNSGNNVLNGGTGNDTLNGGTGKDTLDGGTGKDSLVGGAGIDSLVGGGGVDILKGGGGNDIYSIDASDVLVESTGIDTVRASFGYTLLTGFEKLILTGTAAINGTGNTLANTITGNSGNNVLNGGTGNDTLNGGTGNDTLTGGAGNDTLIHDAADGRANGGLGSDTLKINGTGVTLDLTATANAVHVDLEVIDLTGSGGNTLVLANQDLLAFSTTSNTLRVDGNADDAVAPANGGWLLGGVVVSGGEVYVRYTNGAAVLQVDASVNRTGIQHASVIELSSLNGSNGFVLNGIDANDSSGRSVAAAGDVNGDGFDDLVIGATTADPGGDSDAGESYVVFGKASGFAPSLSLGALNGSNGFVLNGIDANDMSGFSVTAAGDVNGDGFHDLVIGATTADPEGDSDAGESYVVFGKASGFAPSLDLGALNGSNGFVLNGIDANDFSGISAAAAGDVNGDGFGDLVIGAYGADPGGDSRAGESYVVFGKASGFTPSLDLGALNGSNGFVLNGIDANDFSGISVAAAGDVNGDGFDDLVIGAYGADPGGDSSAGESYVVFGKASGFAPSLDLGALNGSNGFVLNGIAANDSSGRSVAAAGDVNGDGFDDLLIGAITADPGGDSDAGESYVVFGKASGFAPSLDLGALNGTNGFVLNGIDVGDRSGFSVAAAGDVNGDGFDDLLIGAPGANPGGVSNAGESYVVFGKASGFAPSLNLGALNGTNGFVLNGIDANDMSGFSVTAAGDVNGDGFDDLLIGAYGADPGGDSSAGESYVVFGGDFSGAVTHLGATGADTLSGTSAAQTFVSAQGNDTVAGGGGADVIRTGGGSDLIRVSNLAFADVDGGSGTDTLVIQGSLHTLDLTTRADNKISGIERINITGNGDNSLVLSDLDLLALSETSNTLRVDGDAGDEVTLSGAWDDDGAGATYHAYSSGAATILIDNDIFVA